MRRGSFKKPSLQWKKIIAQYTYKWSGLPKSTFAHFFSGKPCMSRPAHVSSMPHLALDHGLVPPSTSLWSIWASTLNNSWWQWSQLPLQWLYSSLIWCDSVPSVTLFLSRVRPRGLCKSFLLCAPVPKLLSLPAASGLRLSRDLQPWFSSGFSACFLRTDESEGSLLLSALLLGILSHFPLFWISPRGSALPSLISVLPQSQPEWGPHLSGRELRYPNWPPRCLWVPITLALSQVGTRSPEDTVEGGDGAAACLNSPQEHWLDLWQHLILISKYRRCCKY